MEEPSSTHTDNHDPGAGKSDAATLSRHGRSSLEAQRLAGEIPVRPASSTPEGGTDGGAGRPLTSSGRHLVAVALLFLTAFAAALRLYALGHGLPHQYVPDESTMIGGALRMGASRSLQPSTFIYPALLMYLFAAEYAALLAAGLLTHAFSSVSQFQQFAFIDPSIFYLLPRLAVALMGTATVPVAYLLGRRLYGPWAGIGAAALIAASIMHVQMSHQARHWVPVSLLTLVVLWVSLNVAERGRWRDYCLSGLLVGLTAATSFNGFLLLFMPLVGHLLQLRKAGRPLLIPREHLPMLATTVLAFVLFFALNPYILLQLDRFIAFHSSGESSIGGQIRGHYENYLQQFLEKQGFTFFAEATLAYEPAITLLGIAGAVLMFRRSRRTDLATGYTSHGSGDSAGLARRGLNANSLVLSYPLFHYLMFATTAPSLEQRYMLPAVVVLALPAGMAAAAVGGWLHRRLGGGDAAHLTVGAIAIIALLVASVPSLRYDWLLGQTDTRTLAKAWIESNIPAGSTVAVESYPPPLSPSLDSLREQQQANPASLGTRDQWVLQNGIPAGEVTYQLVRLNLVDTSPKVDNLSPYLATHSIRYFVVTDFRWKSEHLGHLALKSFLARGGKLIKSFPAGSDPQYVPSDILNNMEDPLVELWKVQRPGPTIEIYEVTQ